MANFPLVFADSFDHYNTKAELIEKWTSASFETFPVTGRNGQGIELPQDGTLGYQLPNFTMSQVLVGFAMNWSGGYAGDPYVGYVILDCQLSGSSGWDPVQLCVMQDGRMGIFGPQVPSGVPAGAFGGPSSGLNYPLIQAGVWYYIEFAFELSGTPGHAGSVDATCWVNGVNLGIVGIANCGTVPLLGALVDLFTFLGPNNPFSNVVFDDIYIAESSGGIGGGTVHAGDVKILCYFPAANTALDQWNDQTGTGAADFSDIDSNPPNDNKWIQTQTQNDVSIFGFQSITGSSAYLSELQIPAVQSVVRSVGTGGQIEITAGPGTSGYALSGDVALAFDAFSVVGWGQEPTGMMPWTANLFNAENFGVLNPLPGQEPQLSQFVQEVLELPGTANARVSQAVVEIIMKPSAGNARVSQAIVELLRHPKGENARISQAVIELPTARNSGASAFWSDGDHMMSNTPSWTDEGD